MQITIVQLSNKAVAQAGRGAQENNFRIEHLLL
jgi:hypothetical protein